MVEGTSMAVGRHYLVLWDRFVLLVHSPSKTGTYFDLPWPGGGGYGGHGGGGPKGGEAKELETIDEIKAFIG